MQARPRIETVRPGADRDWAAEIERTIRSSAGARVQPSSIQTTAVSNEVGTYTALFLQPGSYRIDVALDGFRPLSRSGIRLQGTTSSAERAVRS